MTSVGDELLNEIERVSAKRERWRGYARDAGPMGCFGPAIALMGAAIDAGKDALKAGDPVLCIQALKGLQGYHDED